MTREEKIALGVGLGAFLLGGIAFYFVSQPAKTSTPQTTLPPASPTPPSSFVPTTTPIPQPAPAITPASQFPPSWNQFTPVVAGHRYLIQLHSATPFDWSKVNTSAIPGSFTNFRPGAPSQEYYSYTLDATVTHRVQNVMFLLGLTAYISVSVIDLGATP